MQINGTEGWTEVVVGLTDTLAMDPAVQSGLAEDFSAKFFNTTSCVLTGLFPLY